MPRKRHKNCIKGYPCRAACININYRCNVEFPTGVSISIDGTREVIINEITKKKTSMAVESQKLEKDLNDTFEVVNKELSQKGGFPADTDRKLINLTHKIERSKLSDEKKENLLSKVREKRDQVQSKMDQFKKEVKQKPKDKPIVKDIKDRIDKLEKEKENLNKEWSAKDKQWDLFDREKIRVKDDNIRNRILRLKNAERADNPSLYLKLNKKRLDLEKRIRKVDGLSEKTLWSSLHNRIQSIKEQENKAYYGNNKDKPKPDIVFGRDDLDDI